jgi:hypothetical protein
MTLIDLKNTPIANNEAKTITNNKTMNKG